MQVELFDTRALACFANETLGKPEAKNSEEEAAIKLLMAKFDQRQKQKAEKKAGRAQNSADLMLAKHKGKKKDKKKKAEADNDEPQDHTASVPSSLSALFGKPQARAPNSADELLAASKKDKKKAKRNRTSGEDGGDEGTLASGGGVGGGGEEVAEANDHALQAHAHAHEQQQRLQEQELEEEERRQRQQAQAQAEEEEERRRQAEEEEERRRQAEEEEERRRQAEAEAEAEALRKQETVAHNHSRNRNHLPLPLAHHHEHHSAAPRSVVSPRPTRSQPTTPRMRSLEPPRTPRPPPPPRHERANPFATFRRQRAKAAGDGDQPPHFRTPTWSLARRLQVAAQAPTTRQRSRVVPPVPTKPIAAAAYMEPTFASRMRERAKYEKPVPVNFHSVRSSSRASGDSATPHGPVQHEKKAVPHWVHSLYSPR